MKWKELGGGGGGGGKEPWPWTCTENGVVRERPAKWPLNKVASLRDKAEVNKGPGRGKFYQLSGTREVGCGSAGLLLLNSFL